MNDTQQLVGLQRAHEHLRQVLQTALDALDALQIADLQVTGLTSDTRLTDARRQADQAAALARSALLRTDESETAEGVYVELWENPSSEALYLRRRGEQQGFCCYAWDGGLFVADAARMAADPAARPSEGSVYANAGQSAEHLEYECRLVAVWLDGRLQFPLPLGALRFSTLRYLGITFPAQAALLDQAGEAALPWQQRRPLRAEVEAREAALRDFDVFWRTGPNWRDAEPAPPGFFHNFPDSERGAMSEWSTTVWLASRGFRL